MDQILKDLETMDETTIQLMCQDLMKQNDVKTLTYLSHINPIFNKYCHLDSKFTNQRISNHKSSKLLFYQNSGLMIYMIPRDQQESTMSLSLNTRLVDTRTITVFNGHEPCSNLTITQPVNLTITSELARNKTVEITNKTGTITGQLLWLNDQTAGLRVTDFGETERIVLVNDVKKLSLLNLSQTDLSRFGNQHVITFPKTKVTETNSGPLRISYAFTGVGWIQHMHLDLIEQSLIGSAHLYLNINNNCGMDLHVDTIEFYGGNQEPNVAADSPMNHVKAVRSVALESVARMADKQADEDQPATNVGEVGLVYQTQNMILKNNTQKNLHIGTATDLPIEYVYYLIDNQGKCQYEIELVSPWDFAISGQMISVYMTSIKRNTRRLMNVSSAVNSTRKGEKLTIPMGSATEVKSRTELTERGDEWWQTTNIYKLSSSQKEPVNVEIRVPQQTEISNIVVYYGPSIDKTNKIIDQKIPSKGYLIYRVKVHPSQPLYVKVACH